ncbi:methyltransferase family protein [Paraglaciecola sp.]|uniref:methyltransferase family protein n=1 Tax=Paraglaciecola sp. TaxID=1920173 RepID=UPI003EF69C82
MHKLELKVPPVIVLLFCLILVYATTFLPEIIHLPAFPTWAAWISFVVSVIIIFAGVLEFKRAKTTVNPTKPEQASQLVSQGIYRVTRNPMYLGMAFILLAGVLYVQTFFSIFLLCFFVWYMNSFQIKPEEIMIERIFSQEYVEYKKKVRRWL